MLSQRVQNLQIKQMYWDSKQCQKLKLTTTGAPIWLKSKWERKQTHPLEYTGPATQPWRDGRFVSVVCTSLGKAYKAPTTQVSPMEFSREDTVPAFEKSWSPQWEDTALKWWEESLVVVTEENTHTHTPEYSLQLQRQNSKPAIIQYCLSCSITIGCFSKM